MKRLILLLPLVLAACESEQDKLSRLRGDYLTASLNYQAQSERCRAVSKAEGYSHAHPVSGPKRLACGDTLIRWLNQRDLAERELNKFMGR